MIMKYEIRMQSKLTRLKKSVYIIIKAKYKINIINLYLIIFISFTNKATQIIGIKLLYFSILKEKSK